jgi:hypothetical protein
MAHDLRQILHWTADRALSPSAVVLDGRTIQSTPESGARAGYGGHKSKKGAKVHIAVDTLGHLLALVTPADAQEREQVAELAAAVQEPGRPSPWRTSIRGPRATKPQRTLRRTGSGWRWSGTPRPRGWCGN